MDAFLGTICYTEKIFGKNIVKKKLLFGKFIM